MKTPRLKSVRSRFRAAVLVFAGVLSGCVARQQAVTVTTTMGTASTQAHEIAVKLKTSDASKTEALSQACTALLDARQALAQAEIDRRTAGFLRDLNAMETAALRDELGRRRALLEQFAAELHRVTEPLRQQAATAAAEAHAAQLAAAQHPLDRDLQEKARAAAARYLATGAALQQIEARGAQRAYEAVDAAVDTFDTQIKTTAEKARTEAGDLAARYRLRIANDRQQAARKLGPLPTANSDAYDALIKYTEAVKSASDAYKDYLAANSFAADSLVGEFAKSFVQGLVPGTVAVLQGQTTTPGEALQAVTAAGQTVLTDIKDGFASDLAGLKAGVADSLTSAKRDLTALVASKATAFINEQVNALLSAPDATAGGATPAG